MSKSRWKRRYVRYTDEQRIGAVADYLIGEMKTEQICIKWDIGATSLAYWIWQMRDHFKTRWPRRRKRDINDWHGYDQRLDRPTKAKDEFIAQQSQRQHMEAA